MPNTYDINQIRLLATQKMLKQKLKKGDFITVGKEMVSEIEQILRNSNIQFVTLPYAFDVFLITIN